MSLKHETRITREIIKYIKESRGDAFHVHGSSLQRGGEPDISGEVWDDKLGWIHIKVEVKTPEGEPTWRQLHRLKQYHKAGYMVGIVTSITEFRRLVTMWVLWAKLGRPRTGLSTLPYKEIYGDD